MSEATAILKAAANWASETMTAFATAHPEAVRQLEANLARGEVTFDLRVNDLLGEHPLVSLVALCGGYETSLAHQRLNRSDATPIN